MPRKRYDEEFLRRLRNDIPTDWLIKHLGWPCKLREGQFVFVCPLCDETQSAVKRETNLGRCFLCKKNFNPIEFTMLAHQCEFVEAVEFLKPLLRR